MRIEVQLGALLLALFIPMVAIISCVMNDSDKKPSSVPTDLWEKYSQGDFSGAEEGVSPLLENQDTVDAGHYMLALISHAAGKHAEATAQYSMITDRYSHKKTMNDLITYSYIHLGDIGGALNFLSQHRFSGDAALLKALEQAQERPMRTEISSVVELPFIDDALTPYMPGIAVKFNGTETVARLDTGGTYVHLSAACAKKMGLASFASEKTFAGLRSDVISVGIADIELGPVKVTNAPVMIHEKALDSESLATAFDIEMGPIIGTNLLEQFLVTMDGPGRRLVLSPRHDAEMKEKHLQLLRGEAQFVPFALVGDHFMIVRTIVGDRMPAAMFVDSGLVVANEEQGQAYMLTSASVLKSWGVPIPAAAGRFAEIPGGLRIGTLSSRKLTSYTVSPAVWKRFGTWGGLKVDSLLSWGFLKAYCWTIDFDAYQFTFREPGERRVGQP
jgi:hypothetical protein